MRPRQRTPHATTHSAGNANQHDPDGYAIVHHAFAAAGDYVVTVTRSDTDAMPATAHLWVRVRDTIGG